MKKYLFFVFILISISSLAQNVGDSIEISTHSGKSYNGYIEEINVDGFLFKINSSRIIYLSKSEIKNYQTFSRKKLTEINTENLTVNTPSVKEYSLKQLSLLIGLENIVLILKDGRKLKGKIQKIKYSNGIETLRNQVIYLWSDSQKFFFIKTIDIEKIYKEEI